MFFHRNFAGPLVMTVAALPGLPPSCTILRRELSRVINEGVLAASIGVEYGKRLVVGDKPGEQLFAATSVDKMLVAGPMERMPPVPHWHSGRMVLLGDSAHAPSSSSGQGASLAIESAIELARCLRDIGDVTAAFAAYEKLRRERVEKISAQAAKTNTGKTNGAAANFAFGLLMPILTRTFLVPEKMFGPVHRFRIDWDTPVTAG